jgi:hypothetical protein
MLILDLPEEPFWIDLPQQARVLVRPVDTALEETALSEGRDAIQRLWRDLETIRQMGGDTSKLPNLDNDAIRQGIAYLLTAQMLGRAAIIEWEGVGSKDTKGLAELTPANIDRLMRHPGAAKAFLNGLFAVRDAVVSEGNGSGHAANGTSAAGQTTAGGAVTTGQPASATVAAPTT